MENNEAKNQNYQNLSPFWYEQVETTNRLD